MDFDTMFDDYKKELKKIKIEEAKYQNMLYWLEDDYERQDVYEQLAYLKGRREELENVWLYVLKYFDV